MKNVYVIFAFHAHEMLRDLPKTLLSYLNEDNPMKNTIQEEDYLKKRKEENRDVYTICSEFGDRLQAPMCVEFSNELLVQIRQALPEVFARMKNDYRRERLYPLYGHAHHTHVSLLQEAEIMQEITWNRQYLHDTMGVPQPKYRGLFPAEASLSYDKLAAIKSAHIDYVIFPDLQRDKTFYQVYGTEDYQYRPFLLKAPQGNIIAFPRNLPISQEIWRPITKMKREAVKFQGYMLGDYPVFDNEYLQGEKEKYPIELEEGVEIYKNVLRQELEKAPDNGVLVYMQDLELMGLGNIAMEIIEKAWQDILEEDKEKYGLRFVTPDHYIDQILVPLGMDALSAVEFNKISWAPENRLVLRVDGHYPPLGVMGVGPYDVQKTGLYNNPHIYWENGKYYCGIFDTLLEYFGITTAIPADMEGLGQSGYDLKQESPDTQAILYLRLMKRACNWGWQPTEGRQKRPYLKGYLLCSVLLERLQAYPPALSLNYYLKSIDPRHLVGIGEVLKVFIDGRVNYLMHALGEYIKEQEADISPAYALHEEIELWKQKALAQVNAMYQLNEQGLNLNSLPRFLQLLQEYSLAVFMATDCIQKLWVVGPDPGHKVEKVYHYLYGLYPPHFPAMLERIDAMRVWEVEKYFQQVAVRV